MIDELKFNPEDHITKLPVRRKNKRTQQWETDYADYLEVKWRMVWFRDENPEATKTIIKDKIIDLKNRFAYYELEVSDSKGNVEIGVGSETGDDFPDYIEKAYTKAYGRALAALGYGTQFAPELEEGENIVDSPIAERGRDQNQSSNNTFADEMATDAQRRAIYAIYNTLGMNEQEIKELIKKRYNKTEGKRLTKQEASDLIDHLNQSKEKTESKD